MKRCLKKERHGDKNLRGREGRDLRKKRGRKCYALSYYYFPMLHKARGFLEHGGLSVEAVRHLVGLREKENIVIHCRLRLSSSIFKPKAQDVHWLY